MNTHSLTSETEVANKNYDINRKYNNYIKGDYVGGSGENILTNTINQGT